MLENPLHRNDETHLSDETFGELIADSFRSRNIGPDDAILLVARSAEEATKIRDDIEAALGDSLSDLSIYTGDQSALPYQPNSFDAVIHDNPSRGILQRHKPLYETSAVTKVDGPLYYRAPNYLAHSNAVSSVKLFVLGWEDHEDPQVAAILTIQRSHSIHSMNRSETTDSETNTLSDYLDSDE